MNQIFFYNLNKKELNRNFWMILFLNKDLIDVYSPVDLDDLPYQTG